MKELKIAIFSFIILLTCTISNSIFIINSTNNLIVSIEGLPDMNSELCESGLEELESSWNHFKSKASLTSNYAEINKINLLISELRVHYSNQNEEDFDSVVENIINSLNELSRLEKLSFESIF